MIASDVRRSRTVDVLSDEPVGSCVWRSGNPAGYDVKDGAYVRYWLPQQEDRKSLPSERYQCSGGHQIHPEYAPPAATGVAESVGLIMRAVEAYTVLPAARATGSAAN